MIDALPENLREYGIVMSPRTRASLIQAQDDANENLHRVSPVSLVDGRYAVNAGVLSEPRWVPFLEPLAEHFEFLPWPDVLALLPEPDEDFI